MSAEKAITERQCWVSYVRYDSGLNPDSYPDTNPDQDATNRESVWEVAMGVHCASAAEYDRLAAEALRTKGKGFLGSKPPKPIKLWFTQHGYDPALASIAPKINQQTWAMWGQAKQVIFAAPTQSDPSPDQNPLIITEHKFDQLPDQSKIWPPMDRAWIDPKLKDLLFGQTLPQAHKPQSHQTPGAAETAAPLLRTYSNFFSDLWLKVL